MWTVVDCYPTCSNPVQRKEQGKDADMALEFIAEWKYAGNFGVEEDEEEEEVLLS